jgi:hypothetical protein
MQHDADAIEAAEWAYEQFNDKEYCEAEVTKSTLLPDFSIIEGTPDVILGGGIIVDLKSRKRDYRPQMAAYALMWFESQHSALEPVAIKVQVKLLYTEIRMKPKTL